MVTSQPPDQSTLLIAALLILALLFAGYWIFTYVQPGADPWAALPWFGVAAGVIAVVALISFLLPRRGGGGGSPPR